MVQGWGRVGKGREWWVLWLKRRLRPNNGVPVCQAKVFGLCHIDHWEPVTKSDTPDTCFRTIVLVVMERMQPRQGPQLGGYARDAQRLNLRDQLQRADWLKKVRQGMNIH